MGGCGLNGILDGSKVSISETGTYRLPNLLHFMAECSKPLFKPITLLLCPIAVANLGKSTIVEFLIDFDLIPTHELGATDATELIELVHHREESLACLLSKLPTEPILIMIIERRAIHAINVPRHIEEKLEIVTCYLHIMDIHNPEFPNVMVVGLAHLIIDQSWLGSSQPKIVVRTTPIGEMIVDTTSTNSFLFFCIRQPSYVAVIVIAPHQRHVIRHLQTLFVELQHLFIWHKHLHLLLGGTDILTKQLLLVVDDLLQTLQFLLSGFIPLHRPVVNTPHTDGEHIVLRLLDFLQSLNPILLHLLAISLIVKGSALFYIPLIHIVTQQRFAMRRTYHNTATVGHRLRPWNLKEGGSTRMHRRPDGVSPQTQ